MRVQNTPRSEEFPDRIQHSFLHPIPLTETADLLDAAVERRFGEVIGRVLFNPKKQWW